MDFSTGSHQDEGNSGITDLIDPTSEYLPDQLRFFLNWLRLRQDSTLDRVHITSELLWTR
jgi:hypothetical protein